MRPEFVPISYRGDIESLPRWDGLGKVLGSALTEAELPDGWKSLGDPAHWVARVSAKAVPNGIEYTVFPVTKGAVVVPIRTGGIRITIHRDTGL